MATTTMPPTTGSTATTSGGGSSVTSASSSSSSDVRSSEVHGVGSLVPQLIPGLPDEIAEHCLIHLPFPDAAVARSVSSAWRRAVSDPSFQHARRVLSIPRTHLFVFAFHRSTSRLQWLAFDPLQQSWFPLPPMPTPLIPNLPSDGSGAADPADPPQLCPSAFATAADQERGELYVLGGMRADTHVPLRSVARYSTSTNSWRACAPMRSPRSYFAAGSIGGRLVAAGGTGSTLIGSGSGAATQYQQQQQPPLYSDDEEPSGSSMMSSSEVYDPQSDRWTPLPRMQCGMSRYDAAVVGTKMYVTEGWTWPFSLPPRGAAYDAEGNSWGDMSVGMREGWTGSAVVLAGKMFVVSECGDCRVKVYDDKKDIWNQVAGGGVPPELRKPFAVAASEEEEHEDAGSTGRLRRKRRRIYVVAAGMNVAVGELKEEEQQQQQTAEDASTCQGATTVVDQQQQWHPEGPSGRWRVEWEVVKGPLAFAEMSPSSSHVIYA